MDCSRPVCLLCEMSPLSDDVGVGDEEAALVDDVVLKDSFVIVLVLSGHSQT